MFGHGSFHRLRVQPELDQVADGFEPPSFCPRRRSALFSNTIFDLAYISRRCRQPAKINKLNVERLDFRSGLDHSFVLIFLGSVQQWCECIFL
jgi:hypothetical protein